MVYYRCDERRVSLIDVSYATNLYSEVGASSYGTPLFAAADVEYENTNLETVPAAVTDCYALGLILMQVRKALPPSFRDSLPPTPSGDVY